MKTQMSRINCVVIVLPNINHREEYQVSGSKYALPGFNKKFRMNGSTTKTIQNPIGASGKGK